MIRKVSALAMLMVFLLGLVGCDKPAAPAPDYSQADAALDSLQGEWSVFSLNRSGKESNPKATRSITVKIMKDRLLWSEAKSKRPDGDEILIEEYLLQVNPDKASSQVDLVYMTGKFQGQTRSAIYSLEGSELKICMGEADADRPTEFVGKENPPPC